MTLVSGALEALRAEASNVTWGPPHQVSAAVTDRNTKKKER